MSQSPKIFRRSAALIFVVIVVLAASAGGAAAYRAYVAWRNGSAMSYGELRRELFGMTRLRHASVVMVGDSLTAMAPWSEMTGCVRLINRGVESDSSRGVLARIDGIIALRPNAVFLMIGANDIRLGIADTETAANIVAVLDRLSEAGIHAYVVPVLPVARAFPSAADFNRNVDKLNAAIGAALAARPGVTVIDVGPEVRDARGFLKDEFSFDGIHLRAAGYAVWLAAIEPQVKRYCRRQRD
ncbi:MAG TPA: GDSL-type esterase/lipase family protein [Candidatus Cybelea sp.]|nr:GDSL-type esterase/lipase family protein [Candidatus Cybelea sp.]